MLSRNQFGRPIAEFQGLQWMIADMAIGLSASRGLLHAAALSGDDGFPDMAIAAQAKVLASEQRLKLQIRHYSFTAQWVTLAIYL